MGADMLTATIATPSSRQAIDYDAGRRLASQLTSIDDFAFDEPEQFDDLGDQLALNAAVFAARDANGQPTAQIIQHIARVIIDNLEEALSSRETTILHIAGFHVYISAGLSWGDAPTEAAEAIWNAHLLPQSVLEAMGFVDLPAESAAPDAGDPTDTQVVDAIALGLGTRPEWNGADELEWIADAIGEVRGMADEMEE